MVTAAIVSGELLPALIAGSVGILAAIAFIATGESAKPFDMKKDDDDIQGNDDSGNAEPREMTTGEQAQAKLDDYRARGKLSKDQEEQIKAGVRQMKPEHRKAIQDWVHMKDENPWAILGLNLLVLIVFLGFFLLFCAFIIGNFEVNVFDPKVYHRGWQWITGNKGGQTQARTVHHDLAEL
mmetsp:Transcript_30189/g.54807  ORF Transcript_30189/g.54807 Transcript_30189/m.54807 type:complete len:181 (-) Transcript_30189:34-576(-)